MCDPPPQMSTTIDFPCVVRTQLLHVSTKNSHPAHHESDSQCSLRRCYTFDNKANLITDPDFILASNLDTSKYQGVTIGKKEGEVMKHLIYKHR